MPASTLPLSSQSRDFVVAAEGEVDLQRFPLPAFVGVRRAEQGPQQLRQAPGFVVGE